MLHQQTFILKDHIYIPTKFEIDKVIDCSILYFFSLHMYLLLMLVPF